MKLLYVCLGNICRSPLLEAVLRRRAANAGVDCEVASAGTGDWHLGAGADRRAVEVASQRGYDLQPHRARQLMESDYHRFDWLLAADADNLQELRRRRPSDATAQLALATEFARIVDVREVPDPYYGSSRDFEIVVDLAERIADAILNRLTTGA